MALVHTYKGELPDARVILYDSIVDLLLWRWESSKLDSDEKGETPWRQLLDSAGLDDIDVKQVLWALAFKAHAQTATAQSAAVVTADIAEAELLEALRALHPDRSLDWAERLVQIMQRRAGLLVESRPKVYSFPHRTFQEFLAGCYLSVQPDFVDQALSRSKQGVFWREVILLAVGRLVHSGNLDPSLVLVDELCPDTLGVSDDPSVWRRVWLAGECLLEIGLVRAGRRSLGKAVIPRVRSQLTVLITHDHLTPGNAPRPARCSA